MKKADHTSTENKETAQQTEDFRQAFDQLTNKMVNQGLTGQEAMGIQPQALENVYMQAYRLYNTGKYVEAIHLFRLLIMMNSLEPKYALGLAACFHLLKEYQNAVQTYTMCSVLDPQDPLPHYHASDCFLQMKDELSAMLSLEMAIKRAADKPAFSKIKERAQLTLNNLKLNIEKKENAE